MVASSPQKEDSCWIIILSIYSNSDSELETNYIDFPDCPIIRNNFLDWPTDQLGTFLGDIIKRSRLESGGNWQEYALFLAENTEPIVEFNPLNDKKDFRLNYSDYLIGWFFRTTPSEIKDRHAQICREWEI